MPALKRILVIMGLAAAACAPNDGDLPTLVSLPQTTTAPQPVAMGTLPGRPTLPATFTLTPTATETPTVTTTATPSVTPSATITDTPSPTFTYEPTLPPEARPLTSLLMMAAQATLLPTDFVVPPYQGINVTLPATSDPGAAGLVPLGTVIAPASGSLPIACSFYPPANFGTIYAANADLAAQLGCPNGSPPNALTINAAWQPFQSGLMLWLNGEIVVLYGTGSYQYLADTFVEGVDPSTLPDVPPPGLYAPARGFGKAWSQNPSVRSGLGWATSPEVGTQAVVLDFQNGRMVALPSRAETIILVGARAAGTWRGVPGA